MSSLDVLLALDAATTGYAQQRATVRHRHLSPAPMTIVIYRMSGEAGAPLGVCFGTTESDPSVLVAPEPRSRTIRFRDVLNPLAAAITSWLANYQHLVAVDGRPDRRECSAVPQILVPNRATARFVGSVLGRSLRYLKSGDEFPIPDSTIELGTHMTWFAQRSQIPGSCVLVAATDLLRRHWVTGQSDLEDEDLHALLAWIDPPTGESGAEAAAAVETARADGRLPAAGPTPDPVWDRDVLGPLIDRFNRDRNRDDSRMAVETHGGPVCGAVNSALAPTWAATWRAHRLLGGLPAGDSVAARWQDDRRAWSNHVERVLERTAFFRINETAKQSAFILGQLEDSQAELDREELLDDPLVLAGAVADGQALLGTVAAVDATRTEPGKGNRRRYRPTIDLALTHPCPLPIGSEVVWTSNRKMVADVFDVGGTSVTLRVRKGMGTANKPSTLPAVGTQAAFIPNVTKSPPRRKRLEDTPWTHVGAATPTPDEVPA